jgi:hypothetical protein
MADDNKKRESVVVTAKLTTDDRGVTTIEGHPDAVGEAKAALRAAEERASARRPLWTDDSRVAMTRLARRFPTLRNALGLDPWDATAFLRWACTVDLTSGGLHAVRFVLGVWNSTANWVEEARRDGLDGAHLGRFDVFEALNAWDDAHAEGFTTWVRCPFWP